jgi:UDP-N-acetylmuramate--alanine ligase
MKDELVACFADTMTGDDILVLCDPAYFGGTTDRAVGSAEIVAGVREAARTAEHIPDRAACGLRLLELARPGDRIAVMGARDDTLSQFAREILDSL